MCLFFHLIDNFDFCSKIKDFLENDQVNEERDPNLFLFLTKGPHMNWNITKGQLQFPRGLGISLCKILYNISRCRAKPAASLGTTFCHFVSVFIDPIFWDVSNTYCLYAPVFFVPIFQNLRNLCLT